MITLCAILTCVVLGAIAPFALFAILGPVAFVLGLLFSAPLPDEHPFLGIFGFAVFLGLLWGIYFAWLWIAPRVAALLGLEDFVNAVSRRMETLPEAVTTAAGLVGMMWPMWMQVVIL